MGVFTIYQYGGNDAIRKNIEIHKNIPTLSTRWRRFQISMLFSHIRGRLQGMEHLHPKMGAMTQS